MWAGFRLWGVLLGRMCEGGMLWVCKSVKGAEVFISNIGGRHIISG